MLTMKEKSMMRRMGYKVKITAHRIKNGVPCVFYCDSWIDAERKVAEIKEYGVLKVYCIERYIGG